MKHGAGKRAFAILLALLLVLFFGCIKREPDAAAATPKRSEPVTLGQSGSDGEAVYVGAHVVDAEASEENGGNFASADPDLNAVLVKSGGSLVLGNASIDKSGDATAIFFGGQNAAVAVLANSSATLNDCIVTTNGLGGVGLYAGGASSLLTVGGCFLVTSGASSAGLHAADGGSIALTGGNIATEGTNSPCLLLSGGGAISLDGVALSASSGMLLIATDGACELLAANQTLSGAMAFTGDATLFITLQSGSAFAGAFPDGPPARASVALDASSTWSLTADSYVTVLSNADAAHQNILSNGFSIYYDSNAPENAALNGQSFLLPGGGFLAPII